MAESIEMMKKINEITECSICTEVFSDPRVLPCIHTFCLQCLQKWSKHKRSGDQTSCPLCRKDFKMPAGGWADLPKNLIVIELLEAKMKSSSKRKVTSNWCDMCSQLKDDREAAEMFCLICRQYMCRLCSNTHSMQTFGKLHKVITIESGLQYKDLLKMSVSFCTQHKDRVLELYCFDCKVTICLMCFVEEHKEHKYSQIEEVGKDFRKKLREDVDKVSGLKLEVSKQRENLEKRKEKVSENMRTIKGSIVKIGEDIKCLVDSHTKSLMKELQAIEDKQLKEIASAEKMLEEETASVESFTTNCKELIDKHDKGASYEIVRVGDEWHTKSNRLLKSYTDKEHISFTEIVFTSRDVEDLLKTSRSNLVGTIETSIKHPPGLKFITYFLKCKLITVCLTCKSYLYIKYELFINQLIIIIIIFDYR